MTTSAISRRGRCDSDLAAARSLRGSERKREGRPGRRRRSGADRRRVLSGDADDGRRRSLRIRVCLACRGIAKPPSSQLRRCYARDRTSHRRRGSRELIYVTNPFDSFPAEAWRRTMRDANRASLLAVNAPDPAPFRLTQLSHGGGCGCKIAPATLREIVAKAGSLPLPPDLLVGIETSDDAAVWRINERQAIVATTDFFMPIVDDPYDFGAIAATNAISDVYAMGATPLFALALVGMPIDKLPVATIRRILEGGEAVCARAGIPVAGGHTIDSVEPIYGLVAIGVVDPANLKRNAGAQPGDALVLGKPLGVGIYSRRAQEAAAVGGALCGAGRERDAAQHARHDAWHDGVGARADRRHRLRPRGPPARDLPRVGRGRHDRARAHPAAPGRAGAGARRVRHRRVGTQLGGLWCRRGPPGRRHGGRPRAAHRPADLGRPSRRVRARTPPTRCWPSSAPKASSAPRSSAAWSPVRRE